jgi:dipeptide/tripeptide permease
LEALVAGFCGFVGGAALLVGAFIGLYAGASQRVISIVMAAGAGVLISSVAFELMEEAYRKGGFDTPAVGLLLGAIAYFAADWAVSRHAKHRKRSQGQQEGGSGTAITIGALMDGIPESVAIQRRSKQLTRNTVSAILKETSCVSGGNRIERFAYSFHQRFPTPSLRLTKKAFDLRESLFDGAEVR